MINKQKNYNANYEAPTLEIIEVKIEQGFAASDGTNIFIEQPTMGEEIGW